MGYSIRFQKEIELLLEQEETPILKLHGGSDGLLARLGGEANVLSTTSSNWSAVASELIQAASAIVFLISHLSAGVVEELTLIREFDREDRCLVVLFDPNRTYDRSSGDMKGLRERLADFQILFEYVPEGGLPRGLRPALERLLHDAPGGEVLEQSIKTVFTYLEPEFTESEDFTFTETHLWRQLRLLRVMFDDTYWAALKSHGIAFEHFTFPGPWKVAHQVYGLAIATADFRAIRESIYILSLLYLKRGADFALLVEPLGSRYEELASQILRGGEPDTEVKYTSGPDPLSLPVGIGTAIQLFEYAEKAGRDGDPETAVYLYQAAVICALRATDGDEDQRRWITGNMLRDWAKFQGPLEIEWATTNCAFAAKLFRDLATANPDQYRPDLALCLNNLGSLHFKRRNFPLSEAAFIEALEIRRALPPVSESFLVNLHTSLANLGLLRQEMGEHEAARALYSEAIEICERRLDSDPEAIVDLTRLQVWMSTCLYRIPGAKAEGLAYVQRARDNLVEVARFRPESEAALREFLEEAIRAAGHDT
jgi:tetratricopeptide (TPR) repeat protein